MARRAAAAKIIYVYTLKQAIADGELIDITDKASESLISCQVVCTKTVLEKYSHVLRDMLWTVGMNLESRPGHQFGFQLYEEHPEMFVADYGANDEGEPLITIMLEGES